MANNIVTASLNLIAEDLSNMVENWNPTYTGSVDSEEDITAWLGDLAKEGDELHAEFIYPSQVHGILALLKAKDKEIQDLRSEQQDRLDNLIEREEL